MAQWLQSLRPFCAEYPSQEEAEAQQQCELAEALFAEQSAAERLQTTALQKAVDLLALPMMAMLMREPANHRALLAAPELLELLEATAHNDTLPFENLHFLQQTSQLSYEDELLVVLPTSRTGLVVQAHGINNNFHAFTLLQRVMRTHAKELGIRQKFTRQPEDGDGAAEYLWLQGRAYRSGELIDRAAWAWGEAPLWSNTRKQGRCILVALETTERPERSWTGFASTIHDAQRPFVRLKRWMTAEEIAAALA